MATDQEIKNRILELLEKYQPVFKAHQGGAELVSVEGGIVILKIQGRCQGCPLSALTFGLGIESVIKQEFSGVKEIRYLS